MPKSTYLGSMPLVAEGKHIQFFAGIDGNGKTIYYHYKSGKREPVGLRVLNAWLRTNH